MPKAGRNDPCPCGSGRKYKSCCLQQDRISEARDLGMTHGEQALVYALYQYAQSPRFGGDLIEAYNLFFGGRHDPEGITEVHGDDMRLMFEWFAYDYHTSTDRRYVIDLFIETQTQEYAREAVAILQAWSQSVMGLFHVVELLGEQKLGVLDPLRREELVVRQPALALSAKPGQVAIGRLYELDDVKTLGYMTLVLPRVYLEPIVDYVTNAYNIYLGEHVQATWDIFLRENGHILAAFLLSGKAEPLRKHIGPGTLFHDPAISRDKLREFTRLRAHERQQEAREEDTGRRRPREVRTSSGIVLPSSAAQEAGLPQEETPRRPTILIPGRDT